MAEYIDRNDIKWHSCGSCEDGTTCVMHDGDCSNCTFGLVDHDEVMEIQVANVVDSVKYEELKKENLQLRTKCVGWERIATNKTDAITDLRSKIDKALEQTYKVREMVLHSNRTYEANDVLDIIDEISACFERHIGE